MASISKQKLSGSTDGRMVKVGGTSTADATTIHTAHASDLDEIWLWAVNSDTTARKLTIEFGGTAAPDNLIEQTIGPEAGLFLIVPGLLLTNSLVVKAFCASANVVMVGGYVNRVTA